MFTSEVQFGHAGSCANSLRETAVAKNASLLEAGAHVPNSFDSLGDLIHEVYVSLVSQGVIVPKEQMPPPTVPMDYSWARELGLIRKPASFMTSICDERGQELLYAGMPISDVSNITFYYTNACVICKCNFFVCRYLSKIWVSVEWSHCSGSKGLFHPTYANFLKCASWWLLITDLPFPVHITQSSVLVQGKTSYPVWCQGFSLSYVP